MLFIKYKTLGLENKEDITMTDINSLKIGEIKMEKIGIVNRESELRSMFEESRTEINRVFFHESYYKDLMLAAMASRSKIGLQGYRGSGKSYLMDVVLNLIKNQKVDENGNPVLDPDTNKPLPIAWRVQRYLDA